MIKRIVFHEVLNCFIQGRAALISGLKREPVIPTNRPISSTSTSASSPSFSNVEHTRSYSLSRTHSDQTSHASSGSTTPTATRRTSISDTNEKSRRSLKFNR